MIGDFKLGDPQPDAMTSAGPVAGPEADAERDHAARVAAHQAATGWGAESAVRLASMTSRIAKLRRQAPVGPVPAAFAVLAGLADLALSGLAIAGAVLGHDNLVAGGVLTLLAMFVPTVWAAWVLTRVVQRRRVHTYRAEREQLRRDRGCGDLTCHQCE